MYESCHSRQTATEIELNEVDNTNDFLFICVQLKPDWQIMDQFVVHELQLSLANAQLEPGIVSNAEKSAGKIL